MLVATGFGPDPSSPVEPLESLHDRFDALSFTAAHGKFDNRTVRLWQLNSDRVRNAGFGVLSGDCEGGSQLTRSISDP